MKIKHKISRFEYETFNLVGCTTPSLKYRQLLQDLGDDDLFGKFGIEPDPKDDDLLELKILKAELETEYSDDELVVTDTEDREYWIRKLGRKVGLELVATNRAYPTTLDKLACLSDKDLHNAILYATEFSRSLDAKVKAAEKEYNDVAAGSAL